MDRCIEFLDSTYHFLAKKRKENCIDDSDWDEVKFINGYAVFMGYLLMGVRGLGILVVTWTTVVLLGGFVTVLEKKDFWCLTVITLVQTAGVFNFLLEEKLSDISHSSWGLFAAVFATVLKFKRSKKSQDPSSTQQQEEEEEEEEPALAFVLSSIQLLMLAVILCPLAVMYLLGLYISTGLSLWRLIKHDFGNGGGSANLKPALEVLYSLAVAQGVLFGYKELHAYGTKIGLAEFVAKNISVDENIVSGYLDNIVEGCEKDPSFATGRNLVTYAVHLMLEAKSNDCFIDGVRALGTIINRDDDRHDHGEHLLTRSASYNHTIQRLLETLSSRNQRIGIEIREHAARIVALVAGRIHLEQLPGGIHCISCLFDTFNTALTSDSNPLEGLAELVIQGLRILNKLAVHEDNRRIMINTEGLLPKITMAPLILDQLHRNHHEEWNSRLDESRELMTRLMAAPRETGTKPQFEISSNSEAIISSLKSILECSKCKLLQSQRRIVIEIFLDQSVDTTSITAPGSSSRRMIIWILLHIFLLQSHDEDRYILWSFSGSNFSFNMRSSGRCAPWAENSNDGIRILAGAKLQAAMQSTQGEGSATAMGMLQSVRAAFQDLAKALMDAGNNPEKVQAARILKDLCQYYTNEDDYLEELKKAMVDVMPKVLGEILGYGNTSSSNGMIRFQQLASRQFLQHELIHLCGVILYQWYDVRTQLDEIAAKIYLDQKKPVKDFPGLLNEAKLL